MPRKVFFSFHYEDVASFKVNVIRNSWLTKKNIDGVFIDGSLWESSRLKGKAVLKKLIDDIGLKNTSVTAILIGSETFERPWVKYEIVRSFVEGKGILAIHLNRIADKTTQKITTKGKNPLDYLRLTVSADGKTISFQELVNGSWQSFQEVPNVNNRLKNTRYFIDGWFSTEWGKTYKFSDLFPTYCWINDDGYNKFSSWVEEAANQADR